jgi:hypothetical protein
MIRNLIRCTLTVAALSLTAPLFAVEKLPINSNLPPESQVTFRNDTKMDINDLYLSRTSSNDWGKEQLGKHTVRSGDSFTLSQIPCGNYDVKLVDEDGDQCDISAVSLCAESHTWAIKDKDLMKCQARTKQ